MNNNTPAAWENTVFITLDMDWACDEIIKDTLQLIAGNGAKATIFVTHEAGTHQEMSAMPELELGIHPNFNGFLSWGPEKPSVDFAIEELQAIVPGAKSIRSHSLFQCSGLFEKFREHGFTHDANLLIPAGSGIILRPYVDWNGMIRIPYFWEDGFAIRVFPGVAHLWDVKHYLDIPGLKVFNFHPIHLFLNTEALSRYETTRAVHTTPGALQKFRCPDAYFGARSFFVSLIRETKRRGMDIGLIGHIEGQ